MTERVKRVHPANTLPIFLVLRVSSVFSIQSRMIYCLIRNDIHVVTQILQVTVSRGLFLRRVSRCGRSHAATDGLEKRKARNRAAMNADLVSGFTSQASFRCFDLCSGRIVYGRKHLDLQSTAPESRVRRLQQHVSPWPETRLDDVSTTTKDQAQRLAWYNIS